MSRIDEIIYAQQNAPKALVDDTDKTADTVTITASGREYGFWDEHKAHAIRRTFINAGFEVSLIAGDPDRNVYIFDVKVDY